MRSVLKTLIIAIAVMIGIGLGIECFGGIIEVGIEILLFLLCIFFLAAGFFSAHWLRCTSIISKPDQQSFHHTNHVFNSL